MKKDNLCHGRRQHFDKDDKFTPEVSVASIGGNTA